MMRSTWRHFGDPVCRSVPGPRCVCNHALLLVKTVAPAAATAVPGWICIPPRNGARQEPELAAARAAVVATWQHVPVLCDASRSTLRSAASLHRATRFAPSRRRVKHAVGVVHHACPGPRHLARHDAHPERAPATLHGGATGPARPATFVSLPWHRHPQPRPESPEGHGTRTAHAESRPSPPAGWFTTQSVARWTTATVLQKSSGMHSPAQLMSSSPPPGQPPRGSQTAVSLRRPRP